MAKLSPRLAAVVDALPLAPGLHVIEIGCGPGAAARAVAERLGPDGRVVAVDRSERAIAQLRASAPALVAAGRLVPVCTTAEALELPDGLVPFDLAFAVRVGAFDGRHPEAGAAARTRLRQVLRPGAPFLVDGGDPLRALSLAP